VPHRRDHSWDAGLRYLLPSEIESTVYIYLNFNPTLTFSSCAGSHDVYTSGQSIAAPDALQVGVGRGS
jgi:hypothetical protein